MKFIHSDFGQRKAAEILEVSLTSAANVHLMDSYNSSNYKNGRSHHYTGALAAISPVALQIPRNGHSHVAIAMEGLRGSTRGYVRMLPGAVPEMRKESLSSLPGLVRKNVPLVPDAGSMDAEVLGMLVHHVDFARGGYWLIVQSQSHARGRSDTPQGPQRAPGDRQEAERHPRLGGPEEYKRSTRSPGAGAVRRSLGMRPYQKNPGTIRTKVRMIDARD